MIALGLKGYRIPCTAQRFCDNLQPIETVVSQL